MKKIIVVIFLSFAVVAGLVLFNFNRFKQPPEKVIAQNVLAQIDDFIDVKNSLLAEAKQDHPDEKLLQQRFLELRLSYKKFEWAAEYFNPAVARFVNGPPVQEVEMASGQVFEPAGLQVIEGMLFPKYNAGQKPELIRQLDLLQAGCDKFRVYYTNIDLFDWQVFDAAKLEVFRIITLGITGFDNPLTLHSMQEAAVSLAGVKDAMAFYDDDTLGGEDLSAKIGAATDYLNAHSDFNNFDRVAFITSYGNGLSAYITDLEKRLKIHVIRYNRLLSQDAGTLFDKDAFNPDAYAPNPESFSTDKKKSLGRVLFTDPILSGNGKRSCQTCHQPANAFADGLEKNVMIDVNKPLKRNTPSLINAALQPSQFYDLRAKTMEDQANSVVKNKDEMHGSMAVAAKHLWQNAGYRKLFADAFPKNNRTGIDTLEIMNAFGAYERSLVSLNSRFDRYMRGNKAAMNQQEINGFNLFMGKARCATCHYMPLFNGSFPPRFVIVESEVIGVPQTTAGLAVDTDMGRYNQMKINAFKRAFKISTVRNAARTAPYMHNGVFKTLQQVMDFYNKGGGNGLGFKLDNQTLASDKLNLTEKESGEVIAFIKALDSE